MIDLLVTGVDELLDEAGRAAGSVRGARALVSDADAEAAEQKLHPADRRRVLAGRLALRLVAASAAGVSLQEMPLLPIDRSCDRCGQQHGRPRAAGMSLSSSTSGDLVLAASGPAEASVGVDVEVLPEALWAGFEAYALHPQERDGRPGCPTQSGELLAAWTEKEAILKAAGVGLRVAPARILLGGVGEAGRWRAAPRGVHWRANEQPVDGPAADLHSTQLAVGGGARAALAAATPLPVRRRALASILREVDHDLAGSALGRG